MIGKPLDPDKALVRLEKLCARSEHSEGEIRTRLRKWGITSKDADRIIDSLIHNRFLDDNRFALSYVKDKYRFSRWGRFKIRAGLAAAGISSEIASEALECIDPEEYSAGLLQLLRRKNSSLPEDLEPYDRRARLLRFAASRGFEPSLAASLLPQLK